MSNLSHYITNVSWLSFMLFQLSRNISKIIKGKLFSEKTLILELRNFCSLWGYSAYIGTEAVKGVALFSTLIGATLFLPPLFCACATLQLHWFDLGARNNRKHGHSAQRRDGRRPGQRLAPLLPGRPGLPPLPGSVRTLAVRPMQEEPRQLRGKVI